MKRLSVFLATALLATPAFAQEAAASTAGNLASSIGWVGFGLALMMGLAVLGGTMGQSKAAVAALDGIARNPAASGKMTVPLILSLALMESLVLFAFLIGLFLQTSVSGAITKVFGL